VKKSTRPRVIFLKFINFGIHRKIIFTKYLRITNFRLRQKKNSIILKRIKQGTQVKVEIARHDVGFFGLLTWRLYAIKYLSQLNLEFIVSLNNRNYNSDEENTTMLLSRFIDNEKEVLTKFKKKRLIVIRDISELIPKGIKLNIQESQLMQQKYFKPELRIMDQVDSFIRKELGDNFIAVHWRGTDKSTESRKVLAGEFLQAIGDRLDQTSPSTIKCFLASDEESKISELREAIESKYPQIEVKIFQQVSRSTNGKPLHINNKLSSHQRLSLGDEALIECLVLSRANFLIRTTSFLSGWSSIFNPQLDICMLNIPDSHAMYFPDSELVRR
jgi:hypothetical protein